MRHASKLGRAAATFAVCILSLGLTGAGLGGGVDESIAANVSVTLLDHKLVVSRGILKAGAARFVILNKGREPHLFTIEGPGVKGPWTKKLAAGMRATLTLSLRTGAYMLSDQVGRAAPTVRWIVVRPATAVESNGNGSVTVPLDTPAMVCD